MQIKTKAVRDTTFLHLRDAAGAPMFEGEQKDGVRVGVTLYGPGSRPYQEAQTRNNNRLTDRLKAKGKADQTMDERLSEQAEFLASITQSFDHVEVDGSDGQPLSGHELAVAVYSDPQLGFITQQVQAYAGDWANFTPASATS